MVLIKDIEVRVQMFKRYGVFLFLGFFVVSGILRAPLAFADEVDKDLATAVVGDRDDFVSITMKRRGKEGVWFPVKMADAILSDLNRYEINVKELGLQKRKIQFLETQLDVKSLRILDLHKAIGMSEALEEKMQETIDLSEDSRQRAEEATRRVEAEKNAWYRHPVVWMGVGVIVTVVGGVIINKVVD